MPSGIPSTSKETVVYEAKTKPTALSVLVYLDGIEDESRRSDCKELASLMERVTGCTPRMWGTSIVGFDSYHYIYASGHEGDACMVGFSSRKGDISIYLLGGYESAEAQELLSQLGKHKTGKGCLYLRRLSDVNLPILEQMVARSVEDTRRRYPQAKA
jgi:hypothetical protein